MAQTVSNVPRVRDDRQGVGFCPLAGRGQRLLIIGLRDDPPFSLVNHSYLPWSFRMTCQLLPSAVSPSMLSATSAPSGSLSISKPISMFRSIERGSTLNEPTNTVRRSNTVVFSFFCTQQLYSTALMRCLGA